MPFQLQSGLEPGSPSQESITQPLNSQLYYNVKF